MSELQTLLKKFTIDPVVNESFVYYDTLAQNADVTGPFARTSYSARSAISGLTSKSCITTWWVLRA